MPYRRVADLAPDERELRRKYKRIMNLLQRERGARWTSKEWRDARRAERVLSSAFLHHQPVEELYRRWQDWQTAERLLYLKSVREGAV